MQIMKKLFLIILLAEGLITAIPLPAQKITAIKTGSKINVIIDDKFFTSYIFSEDEKYPFFYPVNGPSSGGSVTSMRNSEYPHHSSLFFGCDMVNGGNWWPVFLGVLGYGWYLVSSHWAAVRGFCPTA